MNAAWASHKHRKLSVRNINKKKESGKENIFVHENVSSAKQEKSFLLSRNILSWNFFFGKLFTRHKLCDGKCFMQIRKNTKCKIFSDARAKVAEERQRCLWSSLPIASLINSFYLFSQDSSRATKSASLNSPHLIFPMTWYEGTFCFPSLFVSFLSPFTSWGWSR